MTPLYDSLTSFTEHLEQNLSFTCSKAGWKPDNIIQKYKNKILRWFRYNNDAHLELVGKCFSSAMDSLEHFPVEFNLGRDHRSMMPSYTEFLKTAKLVKKLLKASKSHKVCNQLSALAVKVAGFKYRIEAANGGLDPSPIIDEKLYGHFKTAAFTWKKKQELFTEYDLTERDLKNIKEVCAYPKFAKLLLKDKLISQNFFKWSLRDNSPISPLIQYPSICQYLKSCYIISRLGRFSGDALTIAKNPINGTFHLQKVLQLPFFNGITTEKVSILDESKEVTLKHAWKLPIKKYLKYLKEKVTQFIKSLIGKFAVIKYGKY